MVCLPALVLETNEQSALKRRGVEVVDVGELITTRHRTALDGKNLQLYFKRISSIIN